MFNDNIIERGQEEEKVKITNKETDDNLCEECSQVLNNSDYFLYGYWYFINNSYSVFNIDLFSIFTY